MNSLKMALAASLSTLALASTAHAGGMAPVVVEPAPMPAPAPVPMTYGSDWSGFYVGGQVGYGTAKSDQFAEDAKGAVYGVHAGYNYDFGQFVLGGEIAYDKLNQSDATSGISLDGMGRVGLRAGYDAGSFMPYLTAGAARVNTTGAVESSYDGSYYGLGMDYKLSDSIVLGGEVVKSTFDNFNGTTSSLDDTTVSARVSFQF